MPRNQAIAIARFGVIASTSFILSACGGDDSGSSRSEQATPLQQDSTTPTTVMVEGSAIKGTIRQGLIDVMVPDPNAGGWRLAKEGIRTDGEGGFKARLPKGRNNTYKVVLRADGETRMRCDVLPGCVTPESGSLVAPGEWFWPGNDLEMVTLANKPGASDAFAVLTPLGTLAHSMATVDGHELTYARFETAIGAMETRFGLEKGRLLRKQIDLSQTLDDSIEPADLHAALVNTAFLHLAAGEDDKTLGSVLRRFESALQDKGLPEEAGENVDEPSVELLLLASLDQAEAQSIEGPSAFKDRFDGLRKNFGKAVGRMRPGDQDPEPEKEVVVEEPEEEPIPDQDGTGSEEAEAEPEPDPEHTGGNDGSSGDNSGEENTEGTTDEANEEATDDTGNDNGTPDSTPDESLPDEGNSDDVLPENDGSVDTETPVVGSATLSWQAPLTRLNGESLSMGEIDSYRLRYGDTSDPDAMANEVTVEDGQAMSFTLETLPEGTWYFALSAVDSNGLQSQWSEVVSKTID